tara:strand:+ start:306 stop:551 length:246 start_codon:yes stop_codon:yes gene_type:complete
MKGVTSSLMDFGIGMAGGLVYSLSQAFLGSGLWGGLLGAGVAGSVIKGEKGTIIATILGFQSIVGGMNSSTPASNGNADVM